MILLAYGPAGATRAALRRVRRIAGDSAAIIVVAATPSGSKALGLVKPAMASVAEGIGPAAVQQAIATLRSGPILVLHDDVLIGPEAMRRMADQHEARGGLVVPFVPDSGCDHHRSIPQGIDGDGLDRLTRSLDRSVPISGTVRPVCVLADRDDIAALAPRSLCVPGIRLHGLVATAAPAVVGHSAGCEKRLSAPIGPQGRPLLVANIIVRDEERMLPDCLASIAGVVDRVEICDTGSVDRTVEIAEASGAHVIHREWQEDFGRARNQVLDQSRDAWFILWIDADERLECDDPVRLRRTLATFAGAVEAVSLEIHNVGQSEDDGSRFAFRTVRIFRAEGTRFEGVLHEVVRDAETNRPLEMLDLDIAGLRHLGYTSETIDDRSKRVRNLDLARSEYEQHGGEKAAMDYARSLSLAGGDPAEALRLIEEALDGSGLMSAGGRAHLQGLAGNLALRLGDAERAFQLASAARAESPDDDLAAAVFAEAGAELRRWSDLVAAGGSPSQGRARPLVRTDANRRLFHSLVAAARAHCGDLEGGMADARDIVEVAGEFDGWAELIAAIWTDDPARAVARLAPLIVHDRRGQFAESAAARMAPEAVADLCAGYLEGGGAAASAASVGLAAAVISGNHVALDRLAGYSGLVPTAAIQRLAHNAERRGDHWAADRLREGTGLGSEPPAAGAPDAAELAAILGSWRRVFVAAVDGSLADDLAGAGCRVSTDADEAPFDAVVAGERAGDPALAAMLGGAGLLIGWDAVDDEDLPVLHIGTGAPVMGPIDVGPGVAPELEAAGYQVEHDGSVVVARPPWNESAIAAAVAALDDPDPTGLAVVFIGDPAPEVALALRASLPFSIGLEFLDPVLSEMELASRVRGLDPDRSVLVLAASVIPEPGWVQALWTAHAAAGQPAGVGLLGTNGRVIHAGCDRKGRPFGTGAADPNHPIFGADRARAGLRPPIVAKADALGGGLPVTGSYVGGFWAASLDSGGEGGEQAPLRDTMLRPVLMLGDRIADVPVDLVRDLAGAGATPVVRSASPIGPGSRRSLERLGAVVLDGGGLAGMTAALEPAVTVYLTERALRDDYPLCSAAYPESIAMLAGSPPEDGRLASRAERFLEGPEESLAAVLGALDAPHADVDLSPGVIPPVAVQPGVVSVIIPVWNRWELTAACLASLEANAEAPLEIIVVDNGSGDETPERLAERDLRVITNDENLGFPRAANQGIGIATGEYICVLNNDTEVTKGWLTEMLDALERPGAGLVGPRSNRVSGLQGVPGAPGIDEGETAARWARTWAASRHGESWPATRLVGFCLLGRRALFSAVGGFDEGFGIGNFEDDELGDRVRRSGLELRVADGAVVLHHGGATFATLDADYAAVLGRAGRHYSRGARPSGLLTALVLSDGDPGAARATVASAAVIADRVRVVERAGLPLTELAVADRTEEVIATDWQAGGGVEAALEGVADTHVLVCLAGEQVEFDDWGRIRGRLEGLPPGPLEVATANGPEVRIHPPDLQGAGAVGSRSDRRLDGLRIVR